MKTVKPGRGPSFKSGIAAIFAIVIGIIWTFAALQMEAPAFFPIFGMMFIIFGIMEAISSFANATGSHRFSLYDVVDEREEPDPLNQRFGETKGAPDDAAGADAPADGETQFCPYCGAPVASDYAFCRKCGKKLPE